MKEEEFVLRIFSFLKITNKELFVTWNSNSGIGGAFCRIFDVSKEGITLIFDNPDMISTIDIGRNFLLRTNMLLMPVVCKAVSKQKDKLFANIIGISSIDREKRRFLRIYLDKPMDGTIMVSNTFFPVKIVDLSEAGAGAVAYTNKDISLFLNRSAILQITLFDKLTKINMRFVWSSKISLEQYFIGIELVTDNFQRNILQKLMIDEFYNVEDSMLEFLRFL